MKQVILFIFSGSVAALTNLGVFYFLLRMVDLWYLTATVIAFLCSVAVGFYLQKNITFKGKTIRSGKQQVMLFLSVSLINLVIDALLMLFFVEVLVLHTILAKVVTLTLLACWNFFIYQRIIFRDSV